MYKSRRRPWVKLYCREWLTSTVRFDMTECDRSRFIDLLALAGDSKVPGVVCAGYDGSGHRSGYPIDWLASTMRCSVPELRKSLQLFKKADRVSVTGPEDFPVICITAWKKYQSEYLRQVESVKRKRKLQSSSQLSAQSNGNSTHSPQTEVEGEVEVEGEGDVEAEAEAETKQRTATAAFDSFHCEPFGEKRFQQIWIEEWQNPVGGFADAMERTIQRCASLKVKVPGRFFTHKREIEKIEASQAYKVTPL